MEPRIQQVANQATAQNGANEEERKIERQRQLANPIRRIASRFLLWHQDWAFPEAGAGSWPAP